jgi:hypothetical protein
VPKPLAVVPELEAELDALYSLPPADFTGARNDLVRRLKHAGQDDVAARIKQLRKPTVPLWAVNQLARRHEKEVRALLDSGDRLRVAQQAALRGESDELRAATADERRILRELTQRGEELLREAGHAADTKRVAATLRAAAVDPTGRELLERGRLSEELEATGFGALEGMEISPRSEPERKPPKAPSPAVRRRREERLRKLGERVEKARRDAAKAERDAARAEAALEELRRKAAEAKESLRRVETELEEAQQPDE